MTGGFTFCGVDIADIGLEYAPENKDTYLYSPGATEIHEETFEGHNGGYFYGAYKQPKEIILRCFFEDKHVSLGVMAQAHSLFRIGRSGKLVFKNRPWCYYYTTVTAVEKTEMYNYMNGLFVVTMKSYYPFARSAFDNAQMFYSISTDDNYEEIMANTGMLNIANIAPSTTLGDSENPVTQAINNTTVLLYNPGTERASLGFVFAGTAGEGFEIYNKTTDQKCRYFGFTPALATKVTVDGINGKVLSEKNGAKKLSFLYHDYGFIDLEPSFPIIRDLVVSYEDDKVTTTSTLYKSDEEKDWYKSKYIYLNSQWYRIKKCNTIHELELDGGVNLEEGNATTCIVLMNELKLTLSSTTSLTELSFVYKPTFA